MTTPLLGQNYRHQGKFLSPYPLWLCNKLSKLNLTLVQGYPSRTTEAGTLQRDQFVRTAKSQSKWYNLHAEVKKDTSDSVKSWNTGSSRLNSTYLRIARQAGIASNPPLSRPISQETLRKWERSARESSVICNQAAGFNRCLLKVQQSMQSQLKTIRTESKGKSASRTSAATDELQFLLDFNSSVCHAMAKAMEHLTDFVFVNVANTTLLRRDSYLSYLKAGVKADTLNALRAAPLDLDTLFPDQIVKQAEEDITAFDRNRSGSVYRKGRYHPSERQDKKSDSGKQDRLAWKNISSHNQHRRGKGRHQYSTRPANGQQPYKWQSLCNTFTGKAVGRELHTDSRQSFKCKTSCCFKCSYCARAFTKERNKSRGSSLLSERLYIKICEKCLIGLLTATEKQVHLGPTTHETHTVASQEQLESTRITRKGHSVAQVPAPSLTMVARWRQCASRSTITPSKNMLCKFLQTHQKKGGALT